MCVHSLLYWKHPCAWLQPGSVSSLSLKTWLSLVPQFLLVYSLTAVSQIKKKKREKRKSKAFSSWETTFPCWVNRFLSLLFQGGKQNILLNFPSIPQQLQLFPSQRPMTMIAKKILTKILIKIQTEVMNVKFKTFLSIILIYQYIPINKLPEKNSV